MDLTTLSLVLLGILVITLVVLYFSPAGARSIVANVQGPISLSKAEKVISNTDTTPFMATPNRTFQGFLYLNPLNRTGSYEGCTRNQQANAAQADCETGKYIPCQCDATVGCQSCKHKSFRDVFTIEGCITLEVLATPDAGRQGKAVVQLLVKTKGLVTPPGGSTAAPTFFIETLVLPPLEFQKWTMLTIAVEGRRFDVYYNDHLVHSSKTMYMPVQEFLATSVVGVTTGSSEMEGQMAYLTLLNYKMSATEVSAEYRSKADTRGSPFLSNSFSIDTRDPIGIKPNNSTDLWTNFLQSVPSLSLCPPGGCFSAPTVRPASPLYDWSTT
jgi:hypothetical protein